MDDGEFFKKFFKWVGRGIKKVAKIAKKVAPIALLAAAAFFTFGAALGVTAGWGAVVSGAMTKVGLSGTLASVVGGSIAQAGYGALTGGIGGAVTGKGFVKGAQTGALVGAVTGGVSGGLGIGPGVPGKDAATQSTTLGEGAVQAASLSTTTPAPSLLSRVGKTAGKVWKEANKGSALLGPIIGGVGGGIAKNAQVAAMEERRMNVQNSYNVPAESYYSTPESRQREQESLAPAPKTSLLDVSERILQRRRPQ